MGIQSVVLEHHGDIPILGGNVVHQTIADVQLTGGDLLQTGDHPQGGRLTAAGRTDHDDEFLILDLQIEVRDSDHAAGVFFVDVLQRQTGHRFLTSINSYKPKVFPGGKSPYRLNFYYGNTIPFFAADNHT